ncbi:MAG TPA: type I methionyl aminopeptidase [Candidatus Magasanikbacteria bacterium]|nr:type I methionyl aminopeptidase [Candidatus Magasanikbacteria bacterium]
MALIKTKQELELLTVGGKLLGEVLAELARRCAPGVHTRDLNKEAERLIKQMGGIPSFKGYAPHGETPYPSAICASVNEAVVHTPALPGAELHTGDILSIDIGMIWKGLYTDTAITVPIGSVSSEAQALMKHTRASLFEGIKQCISGNSIADIGKAIEEYIHPYGYGIVRGLVGHGVGHAVHEPPQIPNYFVRTNTKIILQPGMVLALEPMITMGGSETEVLEDEWTVVTKDRSLSAHFEHTVIVTNASPIIITARHGERV